MKVTSVTVSSPSHLSSLSKEALYDVNFIFGNINCQNYLPSRRAWYLLENLSRHLADPNQCPADQYLNRAYHERQNHKYRCRRTFKRYILENVSFLMTVLLTFVIASEVLECKFWSY